MKLKNRKSKNDDGYDPDDLSFLEKFDREFDSLFKPIEDVLDLGLNENDVYVNTQDLKIRTNSTGGVRRLMSTTGGKESHFTDFAAIVEFDFSSIRALNSSIGTYFDVMTDRDGPIVRTMQGENFGETEDLDDAVGMVPPVISLNRPQNPEIYCDDPDIDPYYGEDDEKVTEVMRKHLTNIKIEKFYKRCGSRYE